MTLAKMFKDALSRLVDWLTDLTHASWENKLMIMEGIQCWTLHFKTGLQNREGYDHAAALNGTAQWFASGKPCTRDI